MKGHLLRWGLPTIGAIVGVFVPAAMFSPVVAPMVTLIGLMIAGILPAATLTVNAMKPGLSVKRLRQLRRALRWQILRWTVLFFFAVICASTLILGQVLAWTLPSSPTGLDWPEEIKWAQILPMTVLFTLGYMVANIGSVFVGILRILDLLYEVADTEAKKANDEFAEGVQLEIKSMPERPGFGTYVEH